MTNRELPIRITLEQRNNQYIASEFAQRAFRLAHYDMSPDDPVETALERGLLRLVSADDQDSKVTSIDTESTSGDPNNGSSV